MAIMDSSSLSNLYDPIRKKRVVRRPEEQIRQYWVKKMVDELGYPPGLIAIEKELKTLALGHTPKFSRRIDIVCFAKDLQSDHPLFPLRLIECKKGKLTTRALTQLLGYNHTIGAPFIALANQEEIDIRYRESSKLSQLPRYEDLLCLLA